METKCYFLVDSEIWPFNFIANKNKIPISLINARITTKTYKRWMMIPRIAKKSLICLSMSCL